ncbi:MAG: Maf-like protein [Pelagibacterales bacterium]|nr:Maf-like protein [Pelagibacterales bacterium]
MLLQQNCHLILASTSKIRKTILSESGLIFEAVAPDFDEEEAKKKLKYLSSKEKATQLACGKALSISKNFPNSYVIGSDQICSIDDLEISKSADEKEAFLQLKKLNNQIHFQNNAVVVAYRGKIIFKNFSKAKLKMRKLSDDEIRNYVQKDKSWGSAGSYKYESLGKYLFQKVNGNYHAILGFNIQPILNFFYNKKLISL